MAQQILTQILLLLTTCITLFSAQSNDQLEQPKNTKISRLRRGSTACKPNPCFLPPVCENLSICRSNALCMKECICAPGWSGPRCTKAVSTQAPSSVTTSQAEDSPCKSNPCNGTQCQNYGQCRINSINCTAICDCLRGFIGSRCETPMCDPACVNGKCMPGLIMPYCECNKGWGGKACNNKQNERECTLSCENGGRCKFINITVDDSVIPYNNRDTTNMQCECLNASYVGDLCEDFCNITCGPNGHCEVLDGVPRCICKTNWSGKFCTKYKKKTYPDTTSQWYWYVVGTAIGLAVVLLILLFVIPYVMWQKRA
ncbi:unnamed protein product, partial [Owenia fusiformis]